MTDSGSIALGVPAVLRAPVCDEFVGVVVRFGEAEARGGPDEPHAVSQDGVPDTFPLKDLCDLLPVHHTADRRFVEGAEDGRAKFAGEEDGSGVGTVLDVRKLARRDSAVSKTSSGRSDSKSKQTAAFPLVLKGMFGLSLTSLG